MVLGAQSKRIRFWHRRGRSCWPVQKRERRRAFSESSLCPAQPTSISKSTRNFLRELLLEPASCQQDHAHQAAPFTAKGWPTAGPLPKCRFCRRPAKRRSNCGSTSLADGSVRPMMEMLYRPPHPSRRTSTSLCPQYDVINRVSASGSPPPSTHLTAFFRNPCSLTGWCGARR